MGMDKSGMIQEIIRSLIRHRIEYILGVQGKISDETQFLTWENYYDVIPLTGQRAKKEWVWMQRKWQLFGLFEFQEL